MTSDTHQLIIGNTYPVKEEIKALGGTWNKASQGWMVPAAAAAAARALVASAPASAPRRTSSRGSRGSRGSRYQSNYYQFSGGLEYYRNKAGRCEDAPCCGCCS